MSNNVFRTPHWCKNCEEAGHPTLGCLEPSEPNMNLPTIKTLKEAAEIQVGTVIKNLSIMNNYYNFMEIRDAVSILQKLRRDLLSDLEQ